MANKAASKRSIRQSEAKRLINRSNMSAIKTERKKFLKCIQQGEPASEQFSKTQSILAKAAKVSLIHWKKLGRLVSRMASKMKG